MEVKNHILFYIFLEKLSQISNFKTLIQIEEQKSKKEEKKLQQLKNKINTIRKSRLDRKIKYEIK